MNDHFNRMIYDSGGIVGEAQQTNKPIVTVVTPAYNAERFVKQTIKSVLHQTFTNWEMIIVDDCSTDRTTKIVESYCRKDPRIKLIKLKENAGSGVARNTAIEQAQGRFIAFLDSDDLWMPDKLQKQLYFMLEKDIAFSFTEYVRMKEDGTVTQSVMRVPETADYVSLLKHCVVGCLTVMLDTSKTGKVKMLDLRARQDYVLWLSLTKQGILAYGIPEVLSKYRLVRHSISSNKFKMVRRNWKVYRHIENKSPIKSAWYILNYAYLYLTRPFRK